ncbi:MAG: glycosyltransferase family 8 protein [Porphyromonas sp.]|nr:glycosyltransferase family 8 protein [Porphyromonas sp.]
MTIPLIVAFTPNYLVPAATTLRSVLEASPKEVGYDVVCLVSEMPDEDFRAKLSLIDGGTGRLSFRFLNLEHKLQGAYVDQRYTSAANYRLVIAEELPEYRYAIYTDCDVIVRQDLSRLYSQLDMGDAYIAGVAEAQTQWQRQRSAHFDLEPGSYINSGFLVLNLESMRRDGLSQRFVTFLSEAEYLEFPDQDAINVVCRGRLYYLPPVYNGIRTFTLPAFRDLFLGLYTIEDWQAVAREGNIHYTGEKPWRSYTSYMELWWQTYWRLPEAIRSEMQLPKQVERLARLFSLPGVRRLLNWWQLRTKKQEQ